MQGLPCGGGYSEIFFDDMLESDDCLCIKLDAGPASQLIEPLLKGSAPPVGAVGSNRVKRISHCHDSCQEGNLMAHQSVRVSSPIPPFMMMTDDGPFSSKKAEVLHYLLTDDRVRLNNFVLRWS
jgi:hypothetical protein